MSHKKAAGSAKNLRDSGPQYLGTKLYDGQPAKNRNKAFCPLLFSK